MEESTCYFENNIMLCMAVCSIVTLILIIIMSRIIPNNQKKFYFRSSLSQYKIKHCTFIDKIFKFMGIVTALFLIFCIIISIRELIPTDEIFNVEGISISLAGIVITAIIFITTFGEKEYYIFFSKIDVLKKYGIGKFFSVISFSCIMSIICSILFKITSNNNISIIFLNLYIESILILLFSSIYSLFIVGKIAFNEEKFELKMLKNLFHVFWSNKNIHIKKSHTIDALEYNLAVLLNNYKKTNEKFFDLRKIDEIRYKITSDRTYFKKKLERYIELLSLFCLVISLISVRNEPLNMLYNILIFIVELVIIKFLFKYYDVISDRNGLEILYKDEIKFVEEVNLTLYSSVENYVNDIKNVIAFYYIICKSKINKNTINILLKDAIDFLEENELSNLDKFQRALYYLPVFASGYYVYSNNKINQKVFAKLQTLLENIGLSQCEKWKFYEALNGFIVCTCIYKPTMKDKEFLSNKWCTVRYYYCRYIERNNYWSKLLQV